MLPFELIVFHNDEDACVTIGEEFSGLSGEGIKVFHRDLRYAFGSGEDFDCLVAPGNSFGIMDGGLDALICDLYKEFGVVIQEKVWDHIQEFYSGELPVSHCVFINTGSSRRPYLAYLPTMRVPMRVTRTDNVYNAMRGLLLKLKEVNEVHPRKIKRVFCPLLGAGAGGLAVKEAARQMAFACRSIVAGKMRFMDWEIADKVQECLGRGLGGDPDHY